MLHVRPITSDMALVLSHVPLTLPLLALGRSTSTVPPYSACSWQLAAYKPTAYHVQPTTRGVASDVMHYPPCLFILLDWVTDDWPLSNGTEELNTLNTLNTLNNPTRFNGARQCAWQRIRTGQHNVVPVWAYSLLAFGHDRAG